MSPKIKPANSKGISTRKPAFRRLCEDGVGVGNFRFEARRKGDGGTLNLMSGGLKEVNAFWAAFQKEEYVLPGNL